MHITCTFKDTPPPVARLAHKILSITRMYEPQSVSWVPPDIVLLTHIHFLNHLRSTASPRLSLSHPAPSHAHSSNYSVWIQFLSGTQFSTKCLNLKFPLEHSVEIISSLLCDLSLYTYSCLVICTRTSRQPECFKDHLLYIKASFMKESVLFSGGITTRAAILVVEYWIKEIGCLHHEARVPEDWIDTTPMILPGHVSTANLGNQKL